MLEKIFSYFKAGSSGDPVTLMLYRQIVERARNPHFYADCGVPDSLDGRFDMVMLHAWLVIRRLRAIPPDGQARAQALFDLMFADMDSNLREIGVGDLSVGKRIKTMARAFYGRVDAYDAALASEAADALADALKRNLYGTRPQTERSLIDKMAAYVIESNKILFHMNNSDISAGRLEFSSLPVEGRQVSG